MIANTTPGEARAVWDLPLRIFHWLLPLLIGFSWWSAENHQMEWHQRSGLALCMLISFRLVWGVLGSSTARFASFVKGPASVLAYLRGNSSWGGAGHSPLAGWSTLAMLAALAVQIVSGTLAVDVDGIESGPLSHLVSFDGGRQAAAIHEISFNLLLALIALHLLAIAYYQIIKRQRLIGPMIKGKAAHADDAMIPAPWWRLVLSLALAAALTGGVAQGFG